MSGKGRSGGGRGRGKGHGGRGGGGGGRGKTTSSGTTTNKKQGLCKALGENIYTYDERDSPDKKQSTTREVIKHLGATLGTDIATELENRKQLKIAKPTHSKEAIEAHKTR